MTGRLVILCSSTKPDPYFNVIAHAVLSRGITDFALVSIGDEIDPEQSEMAARISSDLSSLVEALETGEYWYRNVRDGTEQRVPLREPTPFKDSIERMKWGSVRIDRRGTSENRLKELLAEEAQAGSSFDVTACKNSAVAGAVAWLVSRGGSPIYTFELKKQQTYDADDLLPALASSQYIYRELSATPLLVDATREVNAFTLHKRTFLASAIGIAVVVALVSLSFSDTVAFSVLTGLASFASIMSALSFFVRGP